MSHASPRPSNRCAPLQRKKSFFTDLCNFHIFLFPPCFFLHDCTTTTPSSNSQICHHRIPNIFIDNHHNHNSIHSNPIVIISTNRSVVLKLLCLHLPKRKPVVSTKHVFISTIITLLTLNIHLNCFIIILNIPLHVK